MPEFQLDLAGFEKHFKQCDIFTRAYIEAMFFVEEERLAEEQGTMRIGNPRPAHLSKEALDQIVIDCAEFQKLAVTQGTWAVVDVGLITEERAGHCFYYDRQGTGSGFFDERGAAKELGLTVKSFSSFDLYYGDDGLIYLS